jgi:hypothetical protein
VKGRAFHTETARKAGNCTIQTTNLLLIVLFPAFPLFPCETLFLALRETLFLALPRNPGREIPKHLLGRRPVLGRQQILPLRQPIRRQHFIAQLPETSQRAAV